MFLLSFLTLLVPFLLGADLQGTIGLHRTWIQDADPDADADAEPRVPGCVKARNLGVQRRNRFLGPTWLAQHIDPKKTSLRNADPDLLGERPRAPSKRERSEVYFLGE